MPHAHTQPPQLNVPNSQDNQLRRTPRGCVCPNGMRHLIVTDTIFGSLPWPLLLGRAVTCSGASVVVVVGVVHDREMAKVLRCDET